MYVSELSQCSVYYCGVVAKMFGQFLDNGDTGLVQAEGSNWGYSFAVANFRLGGFEHVGVIHGVLRRVKTLPKDSSKIVGAAFGAGTRACSTFSCQSFWLKSLHRSRITVLPRCLMAGRPLRRARIALNNSGELASKIANLNVAFMDKHVVRRITNESIRAVADRQVSKAFSLFVPGETFWLYESIEGGDDDGPLVATLNKSLAREKTREFGIGVFWEFVAGKGGEALYGTRPIFVGKFSDSH